MARQAKTNNARIWEDPAAVRQRKTPAAKQPALEALEEINFQEAPKRQRKAGFCWNCGTQFKIDTKRAKRKKFCVPSCRYQYARNHATAYGQLRSKFTKLIDAKVKKAEERLERQIEELKRILSNAGIMQ